MSKTFVLCPSVILSDPQAILKFGKNEVVIPMATIEELDQWKKGSDSRSANAREAIRILDELRGDFRSGIQLENGGVVRIETNHTKSVFHFDHHKVDNRIASTCQGIKESHPEKDVILISRNRWLRVKCRALGIEAEDYKGDIPNEDDLYTGHVELSVPVELINEFHDKKEITIDKNLYPWQFVTLKGDDGGKSSGLGYYHPQKKCIKKLWVNANTVIYGIRPKNKEQMFALEALLNPEIPLVTINGVAGTGKNIVSIAAGLHLATKEGKRLYDRVLLSKRTVPMGKDEYEKHGYLPGELADKYAPWMQSYVDTLEFLHRHREKPVGNVLDQLTREGIIKIELLAFLRGRSLARQFFIVDEAQNLDLHQVVTIATRSSEGTKTVLVGDTHQIDTPYVDEKTNGFSIIINKFKDSDLAAHVTLKKVERDKIVQEVIRRMIGVDPLVAKAR